MQHTGMASTRLQRYKQWPLGASPQWEPAAATACRLLKAGAPAGVLAPLSAGQLPQRQAPTLGLRYNFPLSM